MLNRSFANHSRASAIFYLATVAALACSAGQPSFAAPPPTPADRAKAFDINVLPIIQNESDLGIINGKLAMGINYHDVAGIGGLWSPPYASSNFMLDGRVNGEKVPTNDWTWRPFQVRRKGKLGDVSATDTTSLVYGHRAAIVNCVFKNSGDATAQLEFFTLGWLDTVRDWGFPRPKSDTETKLHAFGRVLTMQQGKSAIVIGMDSADWKWDVSGNVGRAYASLPAGKSAAVNFVIAIGSADEAAGNVSTILADSAAALAGSETEYRQRVDAIFDKLPTLESSNPQLVRWYNRSLVHLITNQWDLPDFVLQPYYSTGSVNGGCVANYLWNFGELWEIFPLYDPAAARAHIKQFLKIDLMKHYNFIPTTGAASGPWYMINQEKIVGLVYYYVLLTGDTKFLDDVVNGKTIREHMVLHAMFGDDPAKPIGLIDYGDSNSHLELRRGFAYNHISPDLNLRRYATYLRAATLCDLAGKPDPMLRTRAELLKPLVKKELWDADARWFRFKDANGKGDLRYTVQLFKPIGSGVLDRECEEGLLSHLNENEFLSAYGLHSLSKRDPAFDQIDIDNGGGGICTSFPPQIIERLYQAGHPKIAADILQRLLWWGDAMPYWGDSIGANFKDFRHDTPLQCTFDGTAGAQCIIFGVFGVSVRPDGDIVINPHQLPFADKMALKGLKVLGHAIDVRVDGVEYEVSSGDHSLRSAIGKPTVLSANNGQLRNIQGNR